MALLVAFRRGTPAIPEAHSILLVLLASIGDTKVEDREAGPVVIRS